MKRSIEDAASGRTAVTLSDRDLDDATRIFGAIVRTSERRSILRGADATARGGSDPVTEDPHERLALQAFLLREARCKFLPRSVTGEPAWEMLVALYLTEKSGLRHKVGRIAELSRSSPTTAMRNIEALERAGLVEREQDPDDRRAFYLELSKQGAQVMEKILWHGLNGNPPKIEEERPRKRSRRRAARR